MNVLQKLTVKTVPKLWKEREELFMYDTVMFAQDAAVDSAGIAFLVQWAKSQKHSKLIIKNAPLNALQLIKTFRLQDLFEVQK